MSASYGTKRASQFFHFNAIGDAGSSLDKETMAVFLWEKSKVFFC